MDIIELIKDKTSTAPAYWIVEEKITALMVRIYDRMQMCTDPNEKEVFKSWRDDLTRIRFAIEKLTKDPETKE